MTSYAGQATHISCLWWFVLSCTSSIASTQHSSRQSHRPITAITPSTKDDSPTSCLSRSGGTLHSTRSPFHWDMLLAFGALALIP
jgi:hypothetical protein